MQSTVPISLTQVPRVNTPRSTFKRAHGYKTTFNAGQLVPIFVDEVIPGDTFNFKATLFGRMATPLFPLMDNLFIDTHFFFVPCRLVWQNFQKFMGEQENPGDSISFLVPTFDKSTYPAAGFGEMSLYDYFGLPTKVVYTPVTDFPIDLNALIPRSYNLIWNQWFRDENLQDSVVVPTDDGQDDFDDYVILPRGKRKDYFTSALPWPQKGAAVQVPLEFTSATVTATGELPLSGFGKKTQTYPTTNQAVYDANSANPTYADAFKIGEGSNDNEAFVQKKVGSDYPWLRTDMAGLTAEADLTDLGPLVNNLRSAVQLQRFLEKDARGGTRYTELLYSHFGVISPDARLQRPEYLGGSTQPVNVTPIAQTSETDTTPQGNLAAMGTFSASPRWIKSFTEHGYIIGLISARADLTYQQNVDRMWTRRSRYDFYWPTFAHIGEQAVWNYEIFMSGAAGAPNLAFGYQERYAEYRFKNSVVTGLFRSNATQTLDPWHLAQEFASQPGLDEDFIVEDPPMARVQAVPSEPSFIMDSYIDLKCTRPMPVYSIPGLMDHF